MPHWHLWKSKISALPEFLAQPILIGLGQLQPNHLHQHSWQSLKDCDLEHCRARNVSTCWGTPQWADIPETPAEHRGRPEAADSGELQNKTTPNLPREEFVKVEIKVNEEAVQKMLVEATREFKEVVVQGRPDFEIHIIMCDDDLPTPKEES